MLQAVGAAGAGDAVVKGFSKCLHKLGESMAQNTQERDGKPKYTTSRAERPEHGREG